VFLDNARKQAHMLSLNLASGGVYMAHSVTRMSVVSYTTFSPSP